MSRELVSLATEINVAHEAVCHAVHSALAHARRAGDLLNRVKADLDHGAWLPWLAEHCPAVSTRTAQGYMRIAREWPQLEAAEHTQRVAHLPIRQVLALLAEPREPLAKRRALSNTPVACGDYRCPACNHEWSGHPRPLQSDEQRELRRILEEMETFPFVPRTFNYAVRGRGGSPEVVAGAGGAPVFDDIVGGAGATRAQVIRALVRVLQGRKPTALGARALDVAQRRLAGDPSLSPAWLPPDAGLTEKEREEATRIARVERRAS